MGVSAIVSSPRNSDAHPWGWMDRRSPPARSTATQVLPWAFRSAAESKFGLEYEAPAQPLPHEKPWTPVTVESCALSAVRIAAEAHGGPPPVAAVLLDSARLDVVTGAVESSLPLSLTNRAMMPPTMPPRSRSPMTMAMIFFRSCGSGSAML